MRKTWRLQIGMEQAKTTAQNKVGNGRTVAKMAVDDDDEARIRNRAREEERALHSLDEAGLDVCPIFAISPSFAHTKF